MNAHEHNVSAPIDPVKLDRLAEVAIKVGLQLRPGQDLLVTAPTVALPLVRKIAEHAYKAGAGLVTPILSDEAVTLSRYRFGQDEGFDRAAGWLYEGMSKAFAGNTARLAIVGDNPMLLSGEDPARVARASKANSIAYKPALERIVNFDINWKLSSVSNDVPVDVEIDNSFERRLVGDGIGLAGARDPGRILTGQQHRIVANDGEARGVAGEGLRHPLIEPAGSAIETFVLPEPVTRQRDRLVGQDRGHEARPRFVGMLGDLAHQRQRHRRRGHQQILSRPELKSNFDGDFREPVELDGIDRGRDIVFVSVHGRTTCRLVNFDCTFFWRAALRNSHRKSQ